MDRSLLDSTIKSLKGVADSLYKGNIGEGMAEVKRIIPDIATIASWIDDENVTDRLIRNALTPALEAMESREATELADIISYELIEIMQELA